MENTVIQFNGVSKRYHLREMIFSKKDCFWALKDIGLSVERGEIIGLVGRNGAGKTTLMKLASSITAPTKGTVYVNGRVVSLLSIEGATNLLLTCRENIYLLCAIFGLKWSQIRGCFGNICRFAGLDDFLDMPLKRFSSGMISRLSFSIAVHMPSDIILMDEVLAITDAEFQHRCFAKLTEYKRSNKTMFISSHNLSDLQRICSRVIWLDKGSLVKDGMPEQVLKEYSRALGD